MLVLSRHRDESIMIGDNISITIVDIRGDKVRIGISAPANVPVHRQEVYDAIQRENARCKTQTMTIVEIPIASAGPLLATENSNGGTTASPPPNEPKPTTRPTRTKFGGH